MIDIKIVSSHNNWFKRQIPFNDSVVGNCRFIFDDLSDCDYCFVIDGVDRPVVVNCPPRNIVLCVTEPKSVKIYPNSYYRQFGRVASFYKFKNMENIGIKIPILPWMAGIRFDTRKNIWIDDDMMTYRELSMNLDTDRIDRILILTSNKTLSRGHRQRLKFALYLKEKMPDSIDLFGQGFTPFEDKYEILKKYRYTLVIENSQFPNYVTEKLFDAYLAECFPVYIGCQNLADYISPKAYMDCKLNCTRSVIHELKSMISDDVYDDSREAILGVKRNILTRYNAINLLAEFVENDISMNLPKVKQVVNPVDRNLFEKFKATALMNYYQLRS